MQCASPLPTQPTRKLQPIMPWVGDGCVSAVLLGLKQIVPLDDMQTMPRTAAHTGCLSMEWRSVEPHRDTQAKR
jgi:hypothetical protein